MKKSVILIALSLIFTLAAPSSAGAAAPKSLPDIKGHWAEADIQKLLTQGIITGNEKGMYQPAKSITRAEFTALLIRAMSLPAGEGESFEDIGYNSYWARPYIETAISEGIIIPLEIGDIFNGSEPLKRSDMAVMMARALRLDQADNQEVPYSDIVVSNGYITRLYNEYLMRGYKENDKQIFKPEGLTTKAEAATVVTRLLEYKIDPEAYKINAALNENIEPGTPTQTDINNKIQEEKDKQSQSNTYIMEPVLTVEYNTDPYAQYYFQIFFENDMDYSDECKYKIECINYPQLNVIDMAMMTGRYKRYDLSIWRPLGSENYGIRSSMYTLGANYYTTQENIKTFKIAPGMKLDFRFTLVRGNETKIVNKTVVVNDIQFK